MAPLSEGDRRLRPAQVCRDLLDALAASDGRASVGIATPHRTR
jgi:hypothetical protein